MNTSIVASLFFILEHTLPFILRLLARYSCQNEGVTKRRGEKEPPTKYKIKGIGEKLQQILDANVDEEPTMRKAREAFKDIQLGIDHCLLKNALEVDGIKKEESYEVNSRGVDVFSKIWLPKGVTCRLAFFGYGVLAMDYLGFSLSEGLHGYIPCFDGLVDDIEQYSKIKEKEGYRDKPFFLFGQSMGGEIALRMHLKKPNAWVRAILVAPLCKFGDGMLPPKTVKQILIGVAKVFPKQKLMPQRDMTDVGCRDSKKKKLAPYNVVEYTDKPRLGTALELLRTTQKLEGELEQVSPVFLGTLPSQRLTNLSRVYNCLIWRISLPMLILHGEDDVVTDPSESKALYLKAKSLDKELCLYKDAYHSLLEGGPDETILKALNEIISWLEKRC